MMNKDALRRIQEMQAKMGAVQEQIAAQTHTGTAGGGAVTIVVNGQQQLTEVTITSEALEEGAEMLADLVMAAANSAMDASRKAAADQMSAMAAGLGIPPGLL